jgi:hypothetical protein
MSRIRGATSAIARVREARCLELRQAGFTFHQIGKALGVTGDGALKAYHRAIQRLPGCENREEMRALEAARIDTLFRHKWQAALDGDETAFNQVIRLMERRAKLLGLDEPTTPSVQVIFKLLGQIRALPESDLLDLLGYTGDTLPDTLP